MSCAGTGALGPSAPEPRSESASPQVRQNTIPVSSDVASPIDPPKTDSSSETDRSAATLRSLDVPGFEPALLFAPAGEAPRPLVVATHGAGGSAEWECEYWRRLTRERAFLLCLKGTPLGSSYGGYYYRDHRALDRELIAAEQAARTAEPRIIAGSGVYAGFSQGATMGTPILPAHAAAFPYAVLIEGFASWNVPESRRFIGAGGQRVLIACGSKECAVKGKTSVHWLQVAGAQARLEHAPGAGHTPAGAVMERVASALPWLLEGDPHWQ